jgi:radical SAM superfamily enzyme YgiQ (UPF0313 family)
MPVSPSTELQERIPKAPTVDNRSVLSSFEVFACPPGDDRHIQIVRPFAVLSKSTYSAPVTPPIGPAYLAAVLEAAGYTVGIIDAIGEDLMNIRTSPCGSYNLQGLGADEILERIPSNTKVIGVSMMFSQEWVEHRKFIQEIRQVHPEATIVAGGEHPTALPEYVLKDCPEIDYVVSGEGDLTFLELCHCIFTDRNPQTVSGVTFNDKDFGYVANGLSQRLMNIDEIPRPSWHLLPVENYFIDNWTMGIAMGRNMPILGTRGCPYQCTFCSNPTMWTTRYKMRSPQNVVDEIEFMIEEYAANSIDFFDLTAIVKKEWILDYCNEIKKRGIDIIWQLPSGTRSEALDTETLQAIYDTGCKYLVYAPESGSQETLDLIKKKLKLPRLISSVREAVKIGHTVKVNFIIGFPHESFGNIVQTIWCTLKFAWIGVDDCNIAIFTPYPGSEIYNDLRKKGRIGELSDDYFKSLIVQFDFTVAEAYCERVSATLLVLMRMLGQSLFYLTAYTCHPSRLWRLLRNIRKERFQASNLFEQRISDFGVRRKLSRMLAEK